MEQLSKNPEENKKLKIKLDKNGRPICGHIFHKECIDNWIRIKRNQNSTIYPQCPECRAEIKEDEWPPGIIPMQQPQDYQRERAQQTIQQRRREIPIWDRRTNYILQLQDQQQDQSPVLFMGITVCVNGQILKKYLNTDLNLGINNTVGDLKRSILARTDELATMMPYVCPMHLGRQVNNLFAFTGAVTRRNPSFGIKTIYFGNPSNCQELLDYSENTLEMNADNEYNNGNNSLIDMYREYQRDVNIHLDSNSDPYISRVITLHTLRWPPTGPEDPGQVYASFYYNQDNPIIPERFRADTRDERLNPRSTTHSLSWIVVELECTTFSTPTNDNLVTNTLQENLLGGGKIRNKHHKTRGSKKTKGPKKTIRRRIK